jgi:hypothetical protein
MVSCDTLFSSVCEGCGVKSKPVRRRFAGRPEDAVCAREEALREDLECVGAGWLEERARETAPRATTFAFAALARLRSGSAGPGDASEPSRIALEIGVPGRETREVLASLSLCCPRALAEVDAGFGRCAGAECVPTIRRLIDVGGSVQTWTHSNTRRGRCFPRGLGAFLIRWQRVVWDARIKE